MKRILIATALATTLSTAAFAATETQIQQIESFAAGIDVSAMTDAELDQAYAIVTSGMNRGEKISQLRALSKQSNLPEPSMLSSGELARLQTYAPEADYSSITRAQAQSALSVTYSSASEGEISQRVQEILSDEAAATAMAADITAAQKLMIEQYVPDIDMTVLTEDQLDAIIQAIHAGMERGETVSQIESIING